MKSGSVRQAAGSPTPTLLAHPTVSGFTLIELSIVLVIIGFIIGGVVVGQNLIHAAAIRAALSQITRLNTAVNTFSAKFGGLPGDLLNYNSAGMAVPSSTAGTAADQSVGDGLIESSDGCGDGFDGEVTAFLADLSRAQLLDNNSISQYFVGSTIIGNKNLAQYLIPSALGDGTFLFVATGLCTGVNLPANVPNLNYWHLSQVGSINGGQIFEASRMTPLDAASIDSKIDDGIPNTGTVFANTPPGGVDYFAGANKCSSSAGPPAVYDVVANPNKNECSLAIQVGF